MAARRSRPKTSCRGWLHVLVAVCLGLTGCTTLDQLRGERYPEDDNTRMLEQMRPHDKNNSSFLWSNKAHQINRSLGGE